MIAAVDAMVDLDATAIEVDSVVVIGIEAVTGIASPLCPVLKRKKALKETRIEYVSDRRAQALLPAP